MSVAEIQPLVAMIATLLLLVLPIFFWIAMAKHRGAIGE